MLGSIVLSTTHLFAEYFFRFNQDCCCYCISIPISCSSSFSSLFIFGGICSTYPRLISSCSSGLELYALSKHRCWSFLLLPVLVLYEGLLMTALSTTSAVTNLMSCMLAEDITADRGIPFLSVKICLFALPILLLSVGLCPVVAPLKATLYIYYRWIAMSS